MKKLYGSLIMILCGLSLGVNAMTRELVLPPVSSIEVQVPVSCSKRAGFGDCAEWGAMTRGCKAPVGGTCTATVQLGNKTATCTAKNGGTCNARIDI